MKKEYIAPTVKIRLIDGENILAASPNGFTDNGDGTETQAGIAPFNPGTTVDGGGALGKQNLWSSFDDEED